MAAGGKEDVLLSDIVRRLDGSARLPLWYHWLQALTARGLVVCAAQDDGERLATLVPISRWCQFRFPEIAAHRKYVLSRFAFLRRQNNALLLESPRSHAQMELHDSRVGALVHALSVARCPDELGELSGGLSGPVVNELLAMFVGMEFADDATSDRSVEDADSALDTWDFPSLLFHTRSRAGRHDEPFVGRSHRALDCFVPPALKPPLGDVSIELHRPDLERLEREDPPYARIQERRATIRSYGAQPMTAEQLGEFLYRVARVRHIDRVDVDIPGAGTRSIEVAMRPFPGGGGLYEIEFYIAVNACVGLESGLYHYDPLNHRLGRICNLNPQVEQMFGYASRGTGIARDRLQVMAVLAARFQRLAWKYTPSFAYALTLKHVGLIFQSMYLAATAMNLAPCAMGGGDADLFARTVGTDYYSETSVGEFLLGSRP